MQECIYKNDFGFDKLNNSQLFYFLKKEEKDIFIKYFSDVGTGDNFVECLKIEGVLKGLEDIKCSVERERKNNESLIYKVSLAVGVVFSILII